MLAAAPAAAAPALRQLSGPAGCLPAHTAGCARDPLMAGFDAPDEVGIGPDGNVYMGSYGRLITLRTIAVLAVR